MPHIRRFSTGTDSYGNAWVNSGDVVEVTPEQFADLMSIPDFDGVEVTAEELADEQPPADPPAKPARKTAASKD